MNSNRHEIPLVKSARNWFPAALLVASVALTVSDGFAQTAVSSGDWNNTATWTPNMVPTGNSQAFIGAGFVVSKSAVGTSAAQLRVGSTGVGGTVNISNGAINSANTATAAHQVATTANSTAAINISGGTLSTSSASGGGLQVGVGANSLGSVNISSGALTLTGGVQLGIGASGSGSMLVSGGSVTTGSGSGSGIFYVGSRLTGFTTTGSFEQTAGSVTIDNGEVFGVGFSAVDTQNIQGTARITGGAFLGNVRIGRAVDVLSGGGSGTLTIGSGADVSGRSEAWELSGSGEIIFTLGANATFNDVNLTAATDSTAFDITQAGAEITIDGTSLVFSPNYGPISLMTYASGKAPTLLSQSNVSFNFIGFDSQFATPSLTWTNTALVLNVVPEPSTVALILGAAVFGLAARRRHKNRNGVCA